MFYSVQKVNEHQPTLYLIGQELESVLFIHRTCFVNCISHGFIQLKLLNKSSIGTKSKRQQTRRCKYSVRLKCCQILSIVQVHVCWKKRSHVAFGFGFPHLEVTTITKNINDNNCLSLF